ncbi:MAG TPA: metallopeptidase TldD-related protein [Terriglobia bacterium]|nr:metallopeptidase TldD-related protein [Terriglobia bacterium]
MRRGELICATILLSLLPSFLEAQNAKPSTLLATLKVELDRSLRTLKSQPVPPYFLSYEVTDDQVVEVNASFGEITSSVRSHNRQLDIDLRVGDSHLDNTHLLASGFPEFNFMERLGFIQVPLEDNPEALRSIIWYNTDRKYKAAVEQYTKVKTAVQVAVSPEDKSDDFAREPAATYFEEPRILNVDPKVWEEKVRKYTAPFARYGNLYEAQAFFNADIETRWYVNSDGSEIQVSQPFYRLMISALSKAEDGMELPRYESYFAFTPQGLPDDAVVLKDVEGIIHDLEALRNAPVADPYTGPAILSGRASGVFFHEIFGHRVEGHRQKSEDEGQTFKKKVGQPVLGSNFSVYSDPTLRRLGDSDLVGAYTYDNEGVKARRVVVVDHGILKNFLMSRSPIEGFPQSNGHGRRQQGFAAVARQSNLVVEVSDPVSHAELKRLLVEEIKKQNKPFGLYFQDIEGGFTLTGRVIPNAFNVLPIMVYRVYPDGREELVRGVDLIGTPLTTFSKMVAGDNQIATFSGICGAESGAVPVSASSPAVLVSQIEVQKKQKSQERTPILPPPF